MSRQLLASEKLTMVKTKGNKDTGGAGDAAPEKNFDP